MLPERRLGIGSGRFQYIIEDHQKDKEYQYAGTAGLQHRNHIVILLFIIYLNGDAVRAFIQFGIDERSAVLIIYLLFLAFLRFTRLLCIIYAVRDIRRGKHMEVSNIRMPWERGIYGFLGGFREKFMG